MKSKKYIAIIALCIGLVTLLINVIFDSFLPEIFEKSASLRWVFIGIGAGLIGAAASILLSKKMYKDNPQLEKQARINENDERYIQVRKTAAYYMWFVTTFVLAAMSLVFVILNLYIAVWMVLGALAIHIVLYFVFLFRLNKNM
ncbi:MAG: hypothetical protein RR630_08335 [Coprobacillus sp.]